MFGDIVTFSDQLSVTSHRREILGWGGNSCRNSQEPFERRFGLLSSDDPTLLTTHSSIFELLPRFLLNFFSKNQESKLSLVRSSRFTARRRPRAVSVRWQPQLSGPGNFEGEICCQPYRKLHGGQNAVLIAPVRPLLPIQRYVGVSKSPSAAAYFAPTTVLCALTSHPASPHHSGRLFCECLDDSSTPDIVRKILHEHQVSRKMLTERFPADHGTSFSCC